MDNTQIYYVYLTTAAFHHSRTTYSLAIMWTEASSHWKRYVCCWHTKSNILKISSFYVAIMSALASIEFTVIDDHLTVSYNISGQMKITKIFPQTKKNQDFMTNANVDSTSNCGRPSQTVLIVFR